ncbi:MAG TPA: Crp/Fnr family transcriptional regulator [Candidatus Acidoferrum sp.]|nr:Crp/Fnr family transcriptional regulator [Candidatus Acidoferrum sp.]
MKTPYGLRVIEDCVACPVHKDRVFCNLPQGALAGLDAISSTATYPRGSVLFVEGQEPRGVFILCSGRVKLFGTSSTGKSLIFRIAETGEIIGLPSSLSGRPYELTAEALEPLQANFIHRDDFLAFLRENGDAALKIAQMLSEIYNATCQELRYVGLSSSASEKLARFLLDLKPAKNSSAEIPQITLTLSQEEIASMIGSSRETVSRLFASLKKKQFIDVHGSTLIIHNKKALQELAGTE